MIEVNDMKIREQDRCIGGLSSLLLYCINLLLISTEALLILYRRIIILDMVDTQEMQLPAITDFFINTISAVPYIVTFTAAYALVTFLEFRVRNENITGRHQLFAMAAGIILTILFMILVPIPDLPITLPTPL